MSATWAILVHHLSATWAIVGHFFVNTWHYLYNTLAQLGQYLSTTLSILGHFLNNTWAQGVKRYAYSVPGGKLVGLLGLRGSRDRPTGSQGVKG